MDIFGIGVALRGVARVYFQTARASGRTSAMVDGLKDGDRVWFAGRDEARRVERLCRERGLSVECCVCDPKDPTKVFDRPTADGRSIFDHSWVEQYYLNVLEACDRDIQMFQDQSSGHGQAHRETRAHAAELSRWQQFLP